MSFDLNKIPDQPGKIAVVTGANAGLGYETSLGLAQKGMKVIMACRNLEKAEQAKADIVKQAPGADLQTMALDLSRLASVKAFAQAYRDKYSTLDLLINNAGIMFSPYSKTEDGFEGQMAANYFGHFLLTSLLLDLLPDTPDSRVVTLSSIGHRRGTGVINFDDINAEKQYSRTDAYMQTKLACLMFSQELQRKLASAGRKTLSVAAHPGASDTELARHINPFLANILRYTVIPFVTHSPKNGALPTLLAALEPNVRGGDYYGPTGFREMKGPPGKATMSTYSQNQEMAAKLWDLSVQLTGAEYSF